MASAVYATRGLASSHGEWLNVMPSYYSEMLLIQEGREGMGLLLTATQDALEM